MFLPVLSLSISNNLISPNYILINPHSICNIYSMIFQKKETLQFQTGKDGKKAILSRKFDLDDRNVARFLIEVLSLAFSALSMIYVQ